MHKLLARQVRRTLGAPEAVSDSMRPLLAAVDEAYRQADEDRLLLERSLDLTSEELLERNEALAAERDTLRRSEERYRRLFEDDPTAIVVARPDGTIEDCNPAFLLLFGFTDKTEALATNANRLYRDPRDARAVIEALTASDRIENFETEGLRTDGQVVHVVINVVGRFDDGGRLIGVLAFLSNETERRRLEEQLHLVQRIEAVGRLAGGIAHDFNNLLTAILGYSALVHESLPPSDPLRVEIGEITRAGARAADLTRQLLAFSRKQVLDRRPLQLNAVVGEMERMLRRLIGEDVELISKLDPDLGIVEADPSQIEQVVTNLVVNARDALPRGGTISIETTNVRLDARYRSRRPVVPEGSYVMVAVSDDGEGMDAAQQERIFEPFFTTKGPGQGTGLGLAVVYGIVKQSGGFVWVYSERGLGTTFKVYLPRCHRAEPRAVGDGADRALTELSGSETILLVEDEPLVRRLAARILTDRGYRVLAEPGPDAALERAVAEREPIDLLLTDIVMPGMSGQELALQIRRARPLIRVIYMSGYSESIVERQGLGREEGLYLAKPFSAATLLEKVRAALGQLPAKRKERTRNGDLVQSVPRAGLASASEAPALGA